MEYLEVVTDLVDKRESVDVGYLDFSKAFLKVPHQRLLYKLSRLKLDPSLYNWIAEWLKKRKQRVVVNGSESEWSYLKSGVFA